MTQQYKVTATINGYVAARVFVDADSDAAAIDLAKMSIVSRFNKIRAEIDAEGADDSPPTDDNDLRCF